VGRGSLFGASYELHRTLILDPPNTVQSVVGGYSYSRPRGDLFLRVAGGASYFQADPLGDLLTPTVDVQFSAGLGRSTTFLAAYRRQFSQSLGFGQTLLIDYATVSLTQQFGTKVNLTLLGGGSFGTDPLFEGSRYDAVQAGGTITFDIVESFQVGTSFFLLETEQTNIIATENFETRRNLWTVFARYSTSWR
jgi:hypothetical protein